MNCCICGNTENNKKHMLEELYLRTGEAFEYMECGSCGCLQIVEVPGDLSLYYGSEYVMTASDPYVLDFSGFNKRNEKLYIDAMFERCAALRLKLLQPCEINTLNTSILDVGCGNGTIIRNLGAMGFKRAVGLDPFLAQEHEYESINCTVYKGDIFGVTDKYDVVMFNHVLEHMENHKEILLKTRDVLTDRGICVISLPILNHAWKKYGVYAYGLDAPRHLIMHTIRSLDILLEQVGLEKNFFQAYNTIDVFCGSEIVAKGIAQKAYFGNRNLYIDKYFSPSSKDDYTKLIALLNQKNDGDLIHLYVKKT